jgi:hypothetical protein
MRYSNTIALLAFSVPLVAHCKSLYIDQSCASKPGWDEYWKEAQSFAKRAAQRMESSSDTDFNAVFKRIYQTEKSSTEGKYAKSE